MRSAPHPTPYPDLNAVLRELVERVQATLGDTFVAAWLQGSFAVGDFDRHSDVDFIVVIREELSEEQVSALQIMHERIYGLDCEWAQHLEGSYFPQAILRQPDPRRTPLWFLDHGSWSLIHSDHCNTAVVRWVLHEKGMALAGPDPAGLVEPISVDVLRREIWDKMSRWAEEILDDPDSINNRFYQSYAVLNYCRMLHDLHTGTVGSKRGGAEWVKATLDPAWAGLIDRAWAGRPNPAVSVQTPADPDDFAQTLEFVRYVVGVGRQVSRSALQSFSQSADQHGM